MERTKDHGGTDKDSITNLVEVDLRERERERIVREKETNFGYVSESTLLLHLYNTNN